MSYAGIRNGLVTTIQGYGKWAASEISTCDFGIVELSGSAVVLAPGPNTSIRPMAYQSTASARSKEITWDIVGYVFVKDPGSALTWLEQLWTAVDDIFNSVNRDDSLNGQAAGAYIATISRPDPDQFYRLRGIDYATLKFTVRATEYT